jgi:hypothetical protein
LPHLDDRSSIVQPRRCGKIGERQCELRNSTRAPFYPRAGTPRTSDLTIETARTTAAVPYGTRRIRISQRADEALAGIYFACRWLTEQTA